MNERRDESQPERRPTRILLRPRVVDEGQKRTHERTSTRRTVPVQPAGMDGGQIARLVNVSPTGLQLALSASLDPAEELEVAVSPEQTLLAHVRWTKREGDEFIIGAEWRDVLSFEDVWRIRSHGEET